MIQALRLSCLRNTLICQEVRGQTNQLVQEIVRQAKERNAFIVFTLAACLESSMNTW